VNNEMKSESVLTETKRVIYHKDGTFSFITGSKKFRIQLDKAGIEYLGGVEELKKFINGIESGKRKVLITKEALKGLQWSIILK